MKHRKCLIAHFIGISMLCVYVVCLWWSSVYPSQITSRFIVVQMTLLWKMFQNWYPKQKRLSFEHPKRCRKTSHLREPPVLSVAFSMNSIQTHALVLASIKKWFSSYTYLRKPDIRRSLNPHSITWIRDDLKELYFIRDDYSIQFNGSRFIVYFEGVEFTRPK